MCRPSSPNQMLQLDRADMKTTPCLRYHMYLSSSLELGARPIIRDVILPMGHVAHAEIDVAPTVVENVPTGHPKQAEIDVPPLNSLYVPAGLFHRRQESLCQKIHTS